MRSPLRGASGSTLFVFTSSAPPLKSKLPPSSTSSSVGGVLSFLTSCSDPGSRGWMRPPFTARQQSVSLANPNQRTIDSHHANRFHARDGVQFEVVLPLIPVSQSVVVGALARTFYSPGHRAERLSPAGLIFALSLRQSQQNVSPGKPGQARMSRPFFYVD